MEMNRNDSLLCRWLELKIINELNPLDSDYESINAEFWALLCYSHRTSHIKQTRCAGLISTNYSVMLQLKIKR